MRLLAAFLRAPVDARTWRGFGYLLLSLVFAVPPFLLVPLVLVSGVLSVLTVGLPFLAVLLLAARSSIRWFRFPAHRLLGWTWPLPPKLAGRGPLARARALLGDARAWRAVVYCSCKLPLNLLAVYLSGLALVGGAILLLAPAWWQGDPFGLLDTGVTWAESWYLAGDGVVALLLFPWIVRFPVRLDQLLVRALLAPTAADQRIARLQAGRAVLAADAATTLRRVERDLHDGTQARLVAVGMTLSRVEQRLRRLPAGDTDAPVTELTALVGSARENVTDALAELRDIVRTVRPPALDDGLDVAIRTLAARSGLPVAVTVDLDGPHLPDEIATPVYFTAAELLTNVARHAAAGHVTLGLTTGPEQLRLTVADDGCGGASARPGGTGLAGLARRAEALDGRLDVDSPAGGPTTVTLTLPLGA